jgi:DsbC/DsbD-like thiol-disulfide interchange protein
MTALLITLLALFAPKQHVTVAPSTNPATGKPGAKVSLFVDVMPDPGIHVYAPGAKGYQSITLTLASSAGFAGGKVAYPKPETLFFEPLNETVPVYQKPFRLTEAITIAKSAKAGTKLTIVGTVDYQACDDRVCFIPASLPVNWTVDVK